MRSYLIHVPPNIEKRHDVPLVIVLHGGGGNGENAAGMTRMSEKADEEEFLVVYPYGTGRFKERLLTWNAGQCCGYAMDNNVDDVGFIRALIDTLTQAHRVDPKRIYATGISNGAMMAYRLACELSEKIAAIAPVAGSLHDVGCTPSHPVSVIIFHGTADEHVPYEGGRGTKRADPHDRIDKSVAFAASFWAKQNGCAATAQRMEQGNIIEDVYPKGREGSEVIVYTIKVGTHSWPGGTRGWILGDKPTEEISATHLMWEFFVRHPKLRPD